MRPWAIAVRKLLPDLAQGSQDILEFYWFARAGTGFLDPGAHATRVRSPCCQDRVLFVERQVQIINDLIRVPEGTGRMQQQRIQVEIRVSGARLTAARPRHACLSPHRTIPMSAMFASMRQTRCSTADNAKLLFLIATYSLEQHGYE